MYLFLYIFVVWAALLIAQSLGGGLPAILTNLTAAMEHPFHIRWTQHSPASILLCSGAYIMGISLYLDQQGRTRDGEEHGSATWASPRQVNAMFAQKQNKLLTKNVRLGLDTHKHRRSLNVLVIGGSGAAKTRSYVKPNILEANTNYVITDPKSEVLLATGGWLKEKGYDIRVLNNAHTEIDRIFKVLLPTRNMAERPAQVALSHQMLDAMLDGGIALCDAGTGIGKTYAYLVAGTAFSRFRAASGLALRPILISTSSIALQNAVRDEYLPLLSDLLTADGMIAEPLQAVIRKGKSHYVCDERLENRLGQGVCFSFTIRLPAELSAVLTAVSAQAESRLL